MKVTTTTMKPPGCTYTAVSQITAVLSYNRCMIIESDVIICPSTSFDNKELVLQLLANSVIINYEQIYFY